MSAPAWVDHIPKVTPPPPIEAWTRRHLLAQCRFACITATSITNGARHFADGQVRKALQEFGEVEMRRLGLAPPPLPPNPLNPSGLILRCGGGSGFDHATYPTYPGTSP